MTVIENDKVRLLDKDFDERDLLLRLRDGDQRAFTVLYDHYKANITSKLFALLKIDELVEDTLQELFYRVWEKRQSINPEQPIVGYLFRIAANLANDHFRKLARDRQLAASFKFLLTNETESSYQKEIDEALYKLIDQLPQQRKKVFLMCKFENRSYDEVSTQLGISVNAVKDHVVKANKFLKSNYAKIAPWAVYCLAVQTFVDL